MREITGHKVNPANDVLTVLVSDDPGAGGACHRYQIHGFNSSGNPSHLPSDGGMGEPYLPAVILFQNGPIAESGVNGITHEVLLAILVDRLEHFQAGQFACRENAIALTKLQEAQHWLHHRTLARMQRGVEGTHKQ